MSLGEQTICRGNLQSTILMSVSLTPVSVNATTSAEQTFTVNGLLVGDQISGMILQAAWTVLVNIVNARVSANNTLAVSFQNGTGGALTPPAGTYLLEVNRPSQSTLPSVIQ